MHAIILLPPFPSLVILAYRLDEPSLPPLRFEGHSQWVTALDMAMVGASLTLFSVSADETLRAWVVPNCEWRPAGCMHRAFSPKAGCDWVGCVVVSVREAQRIVLV